MLTEVHLRRWRPDRVDVEPHLQLEHAEPRLEPGLAVRGRREADKAAGAVHRVRGPRRVGLVPRDNEGSNAVITPSSSTLF